MLPRTLVLKKPVCGGDDVLDFRAGLRFQKWQRIDENTLIGNQLRCLFQFCQGCARSDTLLEYRARFHLCCWWQRGQIVIGLVWTPIGHDLILRVLRHIPSLCRWRQQVNQICCDYFKIEMCLIDRLPQGHKTATSGLMGRPRVSTCAVLRRTSNPGGQA